LQFYDDPELWKEIGYVIEQGVVSPGERVTLVRGAHSTPTFFAELIQPQDAVQCIAFQDSGEEAEWVADSVLANLKNDGLTPRDVMIVSANPFLKADDAVPLIRALTRRGVPVHYATGDELFGPNPSVPIAIVNRAKGNEAAMVYVVHSEHGAGLQDPVRRRNTLFTAITRSRAWVRITGSGPDMVTIQEEVSHVAAAGYRLVLTVPTVEELNRLPKLKRDVTAPRRRVRSPRRSDRG
jgi:superfamily I DNA and RNA helicase